MTGIGPLQRYRCPFAGWAGEAVDVSPCGDVLILIDEDSPEWPGSVGKTIWRRPHPKWLVPISAREMRR